MHRHMCVCMCVCMYTYTFVHTYSHTGKCKCMYVLCPYIDVSKSQSIPGICWLHRESSMHSAGCPCQYSQTIYLKNKRKHN